MGVEFVEGKHFKGDDAISLDSTRACHLVMN